MRRDQYFDRVQDPGELKIGLLDHSSNETSGGDQAGLPKDIETILDIVESSPHDGRIQVRIKSTDAVQVGDVLKLRASLSSPDQTLDQIFMLRIAEPKKKSGSGKIKQPDERLGLPKAILVYKDDRNLPTSSGFGGITWDKLGDRNIPMDHKMVVYPLADGDSLSAIYINMDSNVLLSHRTKLSKREAIDAANNRYLSAVYFHTLFLYTITRSRKYGIVQLGETECDDNDVDIADYISDLFESFYAQFLLNFDTQELISALEA